jgi:hypothetical protein
MDLLSLNISSKELLDAFFQFLSFAAIIQVSEI